MGTPLLGIPSLCASLCSDSPSETGSLGREPRQEARLVWEGKGGSQLFSLPAGNALELCPSPPRPSRVTLACCSVAMRCSRIEFKSERGNCAACFLCVCSSSCVQFSVPSRPILYCLLVPLTFESTPRLSFSSVLQAGRLQASRQGGRQRTELRRRALPGSAASLALICFLYNGVPELKVLSVSFI